MERTEDQNSGNKTNHIAPLPGEISHLIHGRTVTLTEPNRYFSKRWRLLLPFSVEGVREVKPNVFRLEPKTFERFLSLLRSSLAKSHELAQKGDNLYDKFRPSDWIAWALMAACSARDSRSVWPTYVGDIWEVLEVPPAASGKITAVDAPGEQLPSESVELRVELECEEGICPELSIDVRGEPLRVLEEFWRTDEDSHDKRNVHNRAQNLWRLLSQAIESRLEIERPDRGRPRGKHGHPATYLHDHFGLSWQQVAQRLCQQKHVHGSSCRDNFRKQAEQYWKRERKRLNPGRAQSSPTN